MSRTITRAVASATVAGALILSATPAFAAGELLEAVPAEVNLAAPGPGESQSWDMSVRNLTADQLELGLDVTGESDRLFTGPAPLELVLTDTATGIVIYDGTVADALDGAVSVPELGGEATYTVHGQVTLPREAGNEYQDADGWLRFTFRALAEETATPKPTKPADLAVTGGFVSTAALALAGVLVVTGTALMATRTRRKA